MKEEKQLQMPVNLFLEKSIGFISKKLGDTPDSITIFLHQSLVDIDTAQNPEDFMKIYQKLVAKMIEFYNESQQPNHLLPIFGYLLGDAELRHTCENIESEEDLLSYEIQSIKENIPTNIETLAFPEGIESNLIKKNQISKGSFAPIHKGQYGEKAVVFKIFEMGKNDQLSQTLLKIEEEIKIHSMLNHENIAELIGVIRIPSFLIPMMVIEYVGSDLLDVMNFLIKENKKFSDKQLFQIMFDIVSAIAYLHQNGIIHHDIKPDNILIKFKNHGEKFDTAKFGAELSAKLADFGLAKQLEGKKDITLSPGSPAYAAPEILSKQSHNLSADIYSLGITLWELFHLNLFENEVMKNVDIKDEKVKMIFFKKEILANTRAEIKASTPPNVSKLITKCWQGDPKQRPEAGMIKKDLENNFNLHPASSNSHFHP